MREIKNFKVVDQVYNGKYGSGIIKELYLLTVGSSLAFSQERHASVLFNAEQETVVISVDEIEKMQ